MLGESGAFTDMIRRLVQANLKGRIHAHLQAAEQDGNRRNAKLLKTSGVQDGLIACTDDRKGFDDAIEAVFPHTAVQGCIVHQLRNTLGHVVSGEIKNVLPDLKPIYKAPNEQAALHALEAFAAKWQ